MNYLLRNIDQDLWKKAKIHAAENGISLKDLLIKGLKLVLKKGDK